MLTNYLKTAIRNIFKHKTINLIHVMGLASGLCCCILIALYLQDEFSFNRFHPHAKNIYRVVSEFEYDGSLYYHPNSCAPLASTFQQQFSEIEQTVRLTQYTEKLHFPNAHTAEANVLIADPALFSMFTFELYSGNAATALAEKNNIIISEKLAATYFGTENPIGQTIELGSGTSIVTYQISGVMRDIPRNSSIQADALLSFEILNVPENAGNLGWGAWNYQTFLQLPPHVSITQLEKAFTDFYQHTPGPEKFGNMHLHLQPLTAVHVNINPLNVFPTEIDAQQIYIFIALACLVLLLACINFVNLSVAQNSARQNEVCMRKTIGAGRLHLITQFLGEALIITSVAFALAVLFTHTLLPVFNQFAEKNLHLDHFPFFIGLYILVLLIGALTGLYPALVISAFKPVDALHRAPAFGKNAVFRKMLVVMQFTIAILFVSCTLVLQKQMRFLQFSNPGYEKNNMLMLPATERAVQNRLKLFKQEILHNPNILAASATGFAPSQSSNFQNVEFTGAAHDKLSYMHWLSVDADFIHTMGLTLIDGRDFSAKIPSDINGAYILNKAAVEFLELKQPLQQHMKIVNWGTVIGVVDDFHFESMHKIIEPMALYIYPPVFDKLLVRVQPQQFNSTIHFLSQQWGKMFPSVPFAFTFLDADIARLYKNEARLNKIFNLLSTVVLLLACLGLFGLSIFSIRARTREIGIRKTLGSTVSQIFYLLTKNFLGWILIANLFAWPIAWYAMHKWLQNFAYKIELTIWPFLLAGVAAFAIALLTISWQTIRAATANPVEALRYE